VNKVYYTLIKVYYILGKIGTHWPKLILFCLYILTKLTKFTMEKLQ